MVVGHVSRGPLDCGALNDPAISTTVVAHMEWIQDFITKDQEGKLDRSGADKGKNEMWMVIVFQLMIKNCYC